MAQLDQRHRVHVIGQVQQKSPLAQQRFQVPLIRLWRQRLNAKIAHAACLRDVAPPILRGKDRDPVAIDRDMTPDQRQHALADTAEADHHQSTFDLRLNVCLHPITLAHCDAKIYP